MSKSRVTVLMPVFNAENYLEDSISSILNQTYSDFDFLIIDDGSSDTSIQIIESYKDPRITLIKNGANLKLIATLNKGIELIESEYIMRMDADDISLPSRLEKLVHFMDKNPDTGACSSHIEIFDTANTFNFIYKYPETHADIRISSLHKNSFCHGASIIRTSAIKNTGLRFDPKYLHAEDYMFFIKLGEVFKLAAYPEILYRVRKSPHNVSAIHSDEQTTNTKKIINYQLSKMGYESEEPINHDLFIRFLSSGFEFSSDEFTYIESLMSKLISFNKKTLYLPEKKFSSYISSKWFHLCHNIKIDKKDVYRKYITSELSVGNLFTYTQQLKLWFKTISKSS